MHKSSNDYGVPTPLLKKFEEVTAPVKYLSGEKWAKLNINTKTQYFISTKGRIYSTWSDRIISGKISCGVLVLDYTFQEGKDVPSYVKTAKKRKLQPGTRISSTVQQLVAQTFLPKPKGAHIVVHKSYDKLDNSIDNVAWVRWKKQVNHSRQKPMYRMVRSQGLKLNVGEVERIKALLHLKRQGKTAATIKEIAEQFKVSTMQIYRIQNGDVWAHAGKAVKQKESPSMLSPDTVKEIKEMLHEGVAGKEIAALFGVNESRISRIKRGKYYK